MASPMPVLPDVPSMIVPPGLSRPSRSASSIIFTAMRSLIELPGLNVSILATTSAATTPLGMRFSRTIGVSPMVSRMESQIFFAILVILPPRRPAIAARDQRRNRRAAGHGAR